VGTRLWPRSRQAHPKQFSDITGAGRTMIQATVDRLEGLVPPDHIWVVTGGSYAALAAEQLPALAPAQILAEPSGRNTAPAIGLACVHLARLQPDAVLAVLPADHVIPHAEAFRRSLARAAEAAAAGYVVTLGIEPLFAHTGYGYIKRGTPTADALLAGGDPPIYAVERFLEKPDRATAEGFLREGGYYWNGGIFVFRVDVMLAELERQLPALHAHLHTIGNALDTPAAAAVLAERWAQMEPVSIDVGIMEGAQRMAMTPLHAGWNDVGSWDALENVLQRDKDDNFIALGNALAFESYGNIVFTDKRVVALIGVDDLVIVEDGDALLIGHKHQMQRVRDVVDVLRAQGRDELI
jgi:mannose-1-phosphate guanylyltransferase